MKARSQIQAVSTSPWLIYTHGKNKSRKFQTLCTVNPDDKPDVKTIPCLSGNFIVGSSHGYLILRSHFNKIFYLWDPYTSNLIKLPPITSPKFIRDIEVNTCILTNNPNNNNNRPCLLLLFCDFIVFSYRLSHDQHHYEANNWVCQELELKGVEAMITDTVIDESNMVIYGLSYSKHSNILDRNLVTINVNDQNFITLGPMHLPLPMSNFSYFPNFNRLSHFLIESCGIVYIIVTFMLSTGDNEEDHDRINTLKIWMLDVGALRWVETHSIDDRAFFIDNNNGSVWSWANNGGGVEPNSVYLYKSENNTVYQYKLDDHSVTPLRPCPDLMQPCDVPAWIVLSHHHQRSSVGECGKPQAIISSNQQDSDVVDLDSKKPSDHKHTSDEVISLLPADVIQLISKRLYLFDYLSCRRVCKSLRSQLPLSQCRIHNDLPLFLFSKNKSHGSCQIMDPSRSDSCFITIPLPSKSEKFIDFSKNGWLLFGMGGSSLNYFNIFTGAIGSFPTFDHMEMLSSLGFSTSPTSSNCLTFGIHGCYGIVIVSYHRYGENDWTTEKFIDDDFKFQPWTSSPIFVDRAFYVLDESGHLGVFKLEEEEAHMMFYDKPKLKSEYLYSNHLVECDGQILSVFIGDMGTWVQVFKFDKLKQEWIEVTELRNNILFINHSTSISAAAPEAGMGNRVYLPRLYHGRIVYYSLETGKFHTCGSNHSLSDLCGTAEQLRCCWV